MKNLAGHNVSIFLYRFDLRKNGITFCLNESIAEDMYPDIDKQIQPLVQACSETLMRYRLKCCGSTIMDGNILTDNCFEVMLSKGLGSHFGEREKQSLFNDANEIANLLMEVMSRRTKELEQGLYPGPQVVINKIKHSSSTDKGLEMLGKKKHLRDQLEWNTIEKRGLKRLTPDILPNGVVAKRSYDHRGHCIAFEHETLGNLGKVILSSGKDGNTVMETELCTHPPEFLDKKKMVLKEIISAIEIGFRDASEQKIH